MSCAALNRQGGPCKRRTGGRPLCFWHDQARKPANKWDSAKIFKLMGLIEDGFSDHLIARKLGVTVAVAMVARKRYGVPSRTKTLHSAAKVAELGIPCAKTVAWWIESGWLKGKQETPRGGHLQWQIHPDALLAFIEDPTHWHLWTPDRMPASQLRNWAIEVPGNVRFLTLTEVGRLHFCEPTTVYQWIRKGYLPAVRIGKGNHLIDERDLKGFTPPRIGGRRRALAVSS